MSLLPSAAVPEPSLRSIWTEPRERHAASFPRCECQLHKARRRRNLPGLKHKHGYRSPPYYAWRVTHADGGAATFVLLLPPRSALILYEHVGLPPSCPSFTNDSAPVACWVLARCIEPIRLACSSDYGVALSVTTSADASTSAYAANRKAPYLPPEVSCSFGMKDRLESTIASPIIPGMASKSIADAQCAAGMCLHRRITTQRTAEMTDDRTNPCQ